ncbi:MAG: hypothetical protein ACLTC4_11325 [Hungatella hathewayi]
MDDLSHNGLTGTSQSTISVLKLGHELSAMFVPPRRHLTATWGGWARTVCKSNPARLQGLLWRYSGWNSITMIWRRPP